MPAYQVLLTDRGGNALGQVPPLGLTYERKLGATGSVAVQIRLDNPYISGPNRLNLDTWATELLVLRDGAAVGGGPVVDLDATDATGSTVTVTAAAAAHWLTRRRVLRDLPYVAADPLTVLTSLVAYAQSTTEKGPQADARLDVTGELTGRQMTRTYLGAERPAVWDAVTQLATGSPGFDLTLEYAGTRRLLRATSPYAGVDVDTPLVLGRGGLMALAVKQPGDQLTTRVLAVGNGEGTDQVTASGSAVDLETRYGVHEQLLSATDVKDSATLGVLAAGYLQVRKPPVQVVTATYLASAATPFRFCGLGDRVRVVADRGWLQLDQRLRVVAEKVTVAMNGAETVELTFNTPLDG